MNETLFSQDLALTFDDVLVVPGYSEILPSEVDISADLVPGIRLRLPLISAAMDTVTESALAIAMARAGGIGIIHRNMAPDRQAAEVERVKRSESGMIADPVCLDERATLADARALMQKYRISGIPIVEKGSKRLVGILTNRDIRFCDPSDDPKSVGEFMTRDGLVTARAGTTLEEAKTILQRRRIEKLPLTDDEGRLIGLITVKDISKKADYPDAATDSSGRLLAGAAVGVGSDLETRLEQLLAHGVDVVAIDTAHGHSKGVIQAIRRIRAVSADIPVLAGNVVTAEGVAALAEAGASAVKVGVGAGSICTTRIVSGAGLPQLSAIRACSVEGRRRGVPIIADGGVKYSGDIVKAIVAGADTVMLGSLLAGLEESPGELVLFDGRQYKTYRGMGSMGALQGYGKDRYATGQSGQSGPGKLVPEGVEGMVPYRGRLADYVFQLAGGLRSGCGYAGAANLDDLRTKARLARITNAGLAESHAHSVAITREAPNYSRGD